MTQLFRVDDNRLVDLQPDYPPPSLPLPSTFAKTYLQYRTRPPFRLTPRTPYGPYDLVVYDNLPAPTTAEQILDHLSLFPSFVTDSLVSTSVDGLDSNVQRLVRSVTLGMKKKDTLQFRQVAHTMHTLSSLARCDKGASLLVHALSPRGEKPAAVDRAKSWAREIRSADFGKDLTELADCGLSWRSLAEGLCMALMDALIGVSAPLDMEGRVQLLPPGVDSPGDVDGATHDVLVHFPTLSVEVVKAALRECGDVQSTLSRLSDGWRPRVTIGYRGAGKRLRDLARPVEKLESFGGGADVDWIKRHVAADAAREAMEAEAEAEAKARALEVEAQLQNSKQDTSNDVDGMMVRDASGTAGVSAAYDVYDDEPDEGVLEGETPLPGATNAGGESDSGDEYDGRAGPEPTFGGRGRRGGSRGRGGDSSKRPSRGGSQGRGGDPSKRPSRGADLRRPARSPSARSSPQTAGPPTAGPPTAGPNGREHASQNVGTESRGRGRHPVRPRGNSGGRGRGGRGRESSGPRRP